MIQSKAFSTRSKYLIEAEELSQMIGTNPNLRILNASWYLPNIPRDPRKEHFEARITQDTQFFDIDEVV